MQQLYNCPGCGASVAYGRPVCPSCHTILSWQEDQSYGQYQEAPVDYTWQDVQEPPAAELREKLPARRRMRPPADEGKPGLLEMVASKRNLIVKVGVTIIIAVVIIGAGIAIFGEVSKSFTGPVIASFSSSSLALTSGEEATLQWNIKGATTVSITPEVGSVRFAGSARVSPTVRTIYTLVAVNPYGTAKQSVTIDVYAAVPVINRLSFEPGSIARGQPTTLSWDVRGADSVSVNPDIGDVPFSGSRSMTPATTTVYTLTAANKEGNSTAKATITVSEANVPIILSFSASPESINAGEGSTLTWNVIGTAATYLNQGLGGISPKGFKEVIPTATTTYVLTADDGKNKVTKSVTVTVDTSGLSSRIGPAISTAPPLINSFYATPSSITLADNMTLNWSVKGARSVSISPNVGSVPDTGWVTLIPVETTTYKLTAVNTFGTQNADATVTVSRSAEGTAPVVKSFTASPSTIQPGGVSSLSWNIKGNAIIVIDQGIGVPASKFSQQVSPEVSTTYKLTALNSTGADSAMVTVNVVP